MSKQSIAVIGPTASGKTHRAVCIAKALGGEIISADSRQVYRCMDIGTGKDLEEYDGVPYHLIDIADPGDKYNLHRYLRDFHEAYSCLLRDRVVPVVCGGSGMYVENALKGIRLPDVPVNPGLRDSLKGYSLAELTMMLSGMKSLHNSTDVDSCQRAIRAIEIQKYYLDNPCEAAAAEVENAHPLDSLVVGIDVPRDVRRERISERLRARLDKGMVDEIKGLIDRGVNPEDLIYYGLEYKFVTLYVIGQISFDEMFSRLETAIHQFAKRQMTWFRGMEKRGTCIHWLPYDMSDSDFISEVSRMFRDFG